MSNLNHSFSQWVLELQEGDQLLGTSLTGLVVLQPVLIPEHVPCSPCFLLLLPILRMPSIKGDSRCEMPLGLQDGIQQVLTQCKVQRQEEGRKGDGGGVSSWRRAWDCGRTSPKAGLCLPASVCSAAWRRQRRSRAANLSKGYDSFWALLRPLKCSYWKGKRGNWRCVTVSNLSIGYICFFIQPEAFQSAPAPVTQAPSQSLPPSGCHLCLRMTSFIQWLQHRSSIKQVMHLLWFPFPIYIWPVSVLRHSWTETLLQIVKKFASGNLLVDF